MKIPCVYIVANKRNGTLYTGVTSNLLQRIRQHKGKSNPGFTKKYDVGHLVWYEVHESMQTAIARERSIKEWKRDWKLHLIERKNPYWKDLYEEISSV